MIDLTKINLHLYDFKILVDKSGSMNTNDCPNRITRWEQAHDWSKGIADICSQFDDDGIDVILFDEDTKIYNNVNPAKLDEIFRTNRPGGTTNTALAIRKAVPEYFQRIGLFERDKPVKREKPVILIIFTDGIPDSKKELEEVIVKITTKIQSRKEIGITFLQVGNDIYARDFLASLDDGLTVKGAKFDIVDTKSFAESQNMSSEEIIYAAVTD